MGCLVEFSLFPREPTRSAAAGQHPWQTPRDPWCPTVYDGPVSARPEKGRNRLLDHTGSNPEHSVQELALLTSSPGARESWTLGGRAICVAEEYKYLGLYFHATKDWSYTRNKLAEQAKGALVSLFRRAADLQIDRSKPSLYFRLFDTLVKPVASYACPIWATQLVTSTDATTNALEHIHTAFIRHFWGLRQYVSPWVMYTEHGRHPFVVMWWKQTLAFWNKLVDLPGTSLVGAVFAQNRADFTTGIAHNWTSEFRQFVDLIREGFRLRSPLPPFSIPEHIELYKTYLSHQVADRAGQSIRLSTYFQHFSHPRGRPAFRDWPPTVRFQDIATLVRFRTGCHDLLFERGRWLKIPRESRVCTLCSAGTQDENHMVFHCAELADIRVRFAGLFKHNTLAAFFAFNELGPLAAFLKKCLQRSTMPFHP
jgi:hypothetical protein